MPVESAADLAVFFNADEFGHAAAYTPPGGGAATACTVLLDQNDPAELAGEGRPAPGLKTLQVRVDEIAAPARGGTFLIGATTYTIADRPRVADPDGNLWTMQVR